MKKNNSVKAEMYHLGELPSSWKKDLEPEDLREDLEAITRSNREILSAYKPEEMAEAIRKKMNETTGTEGKEPPFAPHPRKAGLPYLIPAAAMILFGLFLPLMFTISEKTPREEITRVKGMGEPELKVYRDLRGESEILEQYETAEASDLIQLAYQVTAPVYGMIISVDGRGVVTRHLPEESVTAAPLKTGGQQLLPFSYELDDAPDYETFYLITSDKPFPVAPVIDLIAGEAREKKILLDIPALLKKGGLDHRKTGEIHQYAVPVRKETVQ